MSARRKLGGPTYADRTGSHPIGYLTSGNAIAKMHFSYSRVTYRHSKYIRLHEK